MSGGKEYKEQVEFLEYGCVSRYLQLPTFSLTYVSFIRNPYIGQERKLKGGIRLSFH